MEWIPAKKIISGYSEGGWFNSNYNMNIYKGCSHGCIYCDSRSECYQIKEFDRVRAKENALEVIERDLCSKRRKGIIITGAMSDPYNPMEKKYQLTRGSLELIDRYRFGIVIDTKSDLVLRDIDVLQRIASHSPVYVNFTVTAADDRMSRRIERAVCPSGDRLKALKQLHQSGIKGGVLFMPLLPFITDTKENITGVVEQAVDAGTDWVFVYGRFGVTLRLNQREHYYKWLDREFPGLKEFYIARYRNDYECPVPENAELRRHFLALCSRYQIPYSMRGITEAICKEHREPYEQMSIFDL